MTYDVRSPSARRTQHNIKSLTKSRCCEQCKKLPDRSQLQYVLQSLRISCRSDPPVLAQPTSSYSTAPPRPSLAPLAPPRPICTYHYLCMKSNCHWILFCCQKIRIEAEASCICIAWSVHVQWAVLARVGAEQSSTWSKGAVKIQRWKVEGRNQSRTQYKRGSDVAGEYFGTI